MLSVSCLVTKGAVHPRTCGRSLAFELSFVLALAFAFALAFGAFSFQTKRGLVERRAVAVALVFALARSFATLALVAFAFESLARKLLVPIISRLANMNARRDVVCGVHPFGATQQGVVQCVPRKGRLGVKAQWSR